MVANTGAAVLIIELVTNQNILHQTMHTEVQLFKLLQLTKENFSSSASAARASSTSSTPAFTSKRLSGIGSGLSHAARINNCFAPALSWSKLVCQVMATLFG